MKTVRHYEENYIANEGIKVVFDNYFYGYKYDIFNTRFLFEYTSKNDPTDLEIVNFLSGSTSKNMLDEGIIGHFTFYEEIERMKHQFIKDGKEHLFPDLKGKIDKILEE